MNSDADTPRMRAALAAVELGAFLASWVVLGCSLYGTNNDLQLPLVHRACDPNLYPGDPFVATLHHYASGLWQVLWIPFRAFPETPLLFTLIGLQRLLCLFAAGRLARALSGGNAVAEAAAWCLFAFGMTPFLGWGTVLPNYFEHTSVAVAFFLLAVAAVVDDKPTHAALWLGLMGLVNIVHATQAFLLLGLAVSMSGKLRRWETLRAAGLALAVMSPALYLVLRTMDQPPIPSEAFLRLLWFYVPQHFFPSSWLAREWLLAGLACVLVAGGWWLGKTPPTSRRLMLGLSLGHGVLLAGAILAERSHTPGLVTLQLARSSDLWTPVAALFLLATLVNIQSATPSRARSRIGASLGQLVILLVWVWRRFSPWFLLLALAISLPAFWAGPIRKPTLARMAPVLGVLCSLGFFVCFLVFPLGSRVADPVRYGHRPAHEEQLGQWAKRHTPANARFLVDPTFEGFRVLSQRSSFVTWKDGAAMLWSPLFAKTWIERLRALGVDALDPRIRYPMSRIRAAQAFAVLDDSKALQIAHNFDLHYWVVPRNKVSILPIAYQNAATKVLILNAL